MSGIGVWLAGAGSNVATIAMTGAPVLGRDDRSIPTSSLYDDDAQRQGRGEKVQRRRD